MADADMDQSKELQIAAAIQEFKQNKFTGKIEMDFKLGELAGARKQISFLK